MSEVISSKYRFANMSTLKCVETKIGKGASNSPTNGTVVPAGTPIFVSSVSGQDFDVFNATGIASAIATTKMGILMEPWTVSATQTKCKVAYAGDFYIKGIREAVGTTLLPEATITDKMLREADGHCIMVTENPAEIWS